MYVVICPQPLQSQAPLFMLYTQEYQSTERPSHSNDSTENSGPELTSWHTPRAIGPAVAGPYPAGVFSSDFISPNHPSESPLLLAALQNPHIISEVNNCL